MPRSSSSTARSSRSRQGRGQVAAVVGEPGVGKSRLTFELTHSHRVEGWLVLEAGSVSYGKAASYLPVIDLLRGYFRIGDRDTPREIREKVTGKILTLDRALETTLPALLALLGVPGDDPEWQALDPPQRRQRTFDAVKRLLLREAQVQPLLVVFEDLHWIDAETQALLDSLVESLPAARLLLLVNYRPEYEHHWGSKTFYTQVRLDPLPAGERARAAPRAARGGRHRRALEVAPDRADGGQSLLPGGERPDPGRDEGARGRARRVPARHGPRPTSQVPPTVQAMLAARIDRLPPEDKRLLQSAAVIGKDVPFALLAAIADEPEEAVRRGLAHLQAAELLHESEPLPRPRAHLQARAHPRGGVSGASSRSGAAIFTPGRWRRSRACTPILLTEHVERLVDHAVRGEVWDKAAAYGTRAGTRAADRSAPARTAKAYFDTALDALGRLPERRETLEQAIELRCLLDRVALPPWRARGVSRLHGRGAGARRAAR